MLGATMASGMKINYINFVAFPITFGIGVDYAVNIMARYRQELGDLTGSSAPSPVRAPPGHALQPIRRAVHTTGPAVALCSLTTILGYSSLLIAEEPRAVIVRRVRGRGRGELPVDRRSGVAGGADRCSSR